MSRLERLFDVFNIAIEAGARFSRISEIDDLIEQSQAGFFIKHDVHGLSIDRLINFAEQEKSMGVYCTYFFMVPEHPLTAKHYPFEQQIETMLAIQEIGHDLGLHIDPFFLIHWYQKKLPDIFADLLNYFKKHGIIFKCGNIHGNSAFKGLDNNGFGTSFDLFEEIARQPDFPVLKNVPEEIAQTIRKNRLKLADYGISYWGDMPFWSEKNKYIVTNFISDNLLEKKDVLNAHVHDETIGHYKLADRQPPGSRTESITRRLIPVGPVKSNLSKGSYELELDNDATVKLFQDIAKHPVQFLVHPQFYC